MQDTPNVSSEEELHQLRDEGKISEDEYDDLLAAMKKPSSDNGEGFAGPTDDTRKKRRQGKIAFVMMLAAITLPIAALALEGFISGDEPVVTSYRQSKSPDNTMTRIEAEQRFEQLEQQAEQLKTETDEETARAAVVIGTFFALDFTLLIAALVLGAISWPDAYGKATVITIAALGFLALVVAVLGQ